MIAEKIVAEKNVQRNRVAGFVYVLLRDHLTFGQIESILSDHIENDSDSYENVNFEEKNIGKYAKSIADRLLNEQEDA